MDCIDSIQPPERYKIVVFDAKTNKIVLSACKMFDIMDRNVTLVEMLEDNRQAYSSLEAVYLLTPCMESVQRLMDDYPSDSPTGKYKAAHIFFSAPLEDRLFDRLTKSPVSKYIRTLKEINIDFTETLDGKRTQSMKLATLLQSELEAHMRSNPENNGRQQGQGTVLILDRSIDITAAIVHEFTYQAMANDLLPIEDGTKYTYEIENSNGEMESVSVVIDEDDQVFMEIRHAHIVETVGILTSNLNKFIAENEALRGDKDKAASLRNMKDQLANLPQYQDTKAKYSTHIHMAKECMKIFEKFKINELGLVEQQLATGETVDGHLPKQVMAEMAPFLDDPQVSTMDKIRLLMLYMICRDGLRAADREMLFEHAKISEGNAEAIRNLSLLGINVERGGSIPRTKKKPFYPRKRLEDEEQPYDLSRYITKAKKIVEEHLNGTLDTTIYPYTTEAPVDSSESTRSLRKTPQPTWEKKKPNVKGSRLIVFIAGGVTYSEIRAMYELCQSMGRDIVIGSTHIITPRQFIQSLRYLARGPTRPTAPIIPPYKAPAAPPKPSAARPAQPPPSSPHRPITPGTSSNGGMRTIQKDATGRFVAPPSSQTPPPRPANAPPPMQSGSEPVVEKKKGRMFGFM
ncbi:vacuolar sorting protein VPS33/slp1 [Entomortierella chlamydospora]|uniref:Vacuolar sorting protein VPS33/slp1 n=1 Tax=Entomortierella chlamydospora TaxID=101097 RepID=A0A9P6N135_9FUNG|nr:vacuolar sorting protein VPS33/slp1 [Entomortierella chlamydospora]